MVGDDLFEKFNEEFGAPELKLLDVEVRRLDVEVKCLEVEIIIRGSS